MELLVTTSIRMVWSALKAVQQLPKDFTRINSSLLLFSWLKGKKSMRRPKIYFEQIPVKIVKLIAEELPAKKKVPSSDVPLKPCREKHSRFALQKGNPND